MVRVITSLFRGRSTCDASELREIWWQEGIFTRCLLVAIGVKALRPTHGFHSFFIGW